MIVIHVDNSSCLIQGLSVEHHRSLSELLSYTLNPTARFFSGGYGPKKQSLLTKRGEFPTGLLYLVGRFLEKNSLPFRSVDLRRAVKPQVGLFQISLPYPPYADQEAAAEAARGLKRGIIVAPTGVGKSLIVALIVQKLQVRTLIVVPSLELKRQLNKSLGEMFGTENLGKGKALWIQNVDSLDPEDKNHGYDCVIIDEFHHSGAKTYRKLNKKAWSTVYYKFGLTATPFRSDENERLLLEGVLSKVIYRVDYSKAVDNGYIVPMEAYYVEIPRTETEGNNWAKVYSELVVNNSQRNEIIAQLIQTLKNSKLSVLCLVKEIAHGETLSSLANVHFANGQSDDGEDLIRFYSQDKIKALIGTTGVLGEGVDTKPAEYIIIAGLGKSKNAFMQQVGRGFRRFENKESCKIILFLDRSHKWTRDHFKAQCKYLLEEYGVVPVELKLTE